MSRAPRGFASSARVHPSFLPHLRRPRRMPSRWFASLIALSAAGYAAKAYLDGARQRRAAQAEREAAAVQLQRRNDALMDVYGDRSSLDELERAVRFYEKKKP